MMTLLKEEYDVVIVGCGPAGTSTAKRCAELGLSVLALDRNMEIGTPVRCGEGMSANSVKKLALNMPESCIAQKIDGAVIFAPNGKKIDVAFEGTDGYVLERKIFDKWLAMEAARAGATIISKSNVTDVIKEGDFVKGVKAKILDEKELEIRAKVVVAADGVESIILRKAGIKSNKNPKFIDSGYQYEMTNLKLEYPSRIVLYFGNETAPRGYVWVFPKGKDTANVGIGIAALHDKHSAKYYLDKFIDNTPFLRKGSIIEVNGGAIPVGGFMENMVGNGVLGVGDAVNQVNPIHGGGIAESILAGRIAGEIISKAIKSGDVSEKGLSEYNRRWWAEAGERLQKVEKVRETFENMDDNKLNDAADVLDGDTLVDFAHGKSLAKLAKLYVKYRAEGIKRTLGLKKG